MHLSTGAVAAATVELDTVRSRYALIMSEEALHAAEARAQAQPLARTTTCRQPLDLSGMRAGCQPIYM